MTPSATDLRELAQGVVRSRSRALKRFRSGRSDGPATAAILSRTFDRFIGTVLRPWTGQAAGGGGVGQTHDCGFAVLALGSYGRSGLSLHSDVDCVILHLGAEPRGPVEAMADAVRALWDAGIRARVAVYSPARARRLAAGDERVLASLLDHRFIVGSPTAVAGLQGALAGLPDRHVRRLARLILREDEARTGTRYQDLFAAEPDVKTGQGGLRDAAALGWFVTWTRIRAMGCPGRDTPRPVGHDHPPPALPPRGLARSTPPTPTGLLAKPGVRAVLQEVFRRASILGRARATLVTARLLLDVAGLPRDRFTREAAWILERERVPPYTPVEFERDLAVARMQVSGLLKALVNAVVARSGPADFGDDLTVRLVASHDTRTRAFPVPLPPPSPAGMADRVSPVATRAFLDVLSSRHPRPTLETLLRTGALHRVVPGFHRTVGLVPGDEVHAFTLNRHLVLAAAAVADAVDGLAPMPPGTGEAVRTGERHRVPLLLAALLHDLGKTAVVGASGRRHPPAHPEIGARLARVAALKLGLPRERADLVAFLCRHHMVLPEAATTLDCESPEVLRRLARVFPDTERLDLAFLVGLSDMRSLGPETATTFREALLARAWSAVRRWLSARDGTVGWEAEASARKDRLSARCAAGGCDDRLRDLVRSLPDRLLMAFDLDRLWDCLLRFEVVRREGPMVLVESTRATRDGAATDHEIVYLGRDELGLLSRLSGGLTLQGLSIQEARIFSISPILDRPGPSTHPSDTATVTTYPLVLDQFRVTDPQGVIGESREARQALADRILASAADPTVARRLQGRIREALRSRGAEMIAEVDNTSLPDRTVFRVAGPDAPGLLHVLADILYRHGINVTGAIVTTEAGTARDTFFAEWAASRGKVLDPEVIRKVLRAISQLGRTA